MKYFPLKTALICLLITPVLYIAGISTSQQYFQSCYHKRIQNIFIGDTTQLLDGRVSLEHQVAQNIYRFLKQDRLLKLIGFDLNITVITSNGRYIYPTYSGSNAFSEGLESRADMERLAKENFEILNQGLKVQVDILVSHVSPMAAVILLASLLISCGLFIMFYRSGSQKAAREERKNRELIKDQRDQAQKLQEDLNRLEEDRRGLNSRITELKGQHQEDRQKLIDNEEELFDEIISLEEQLKDYEKQQEAKQEEILELEEKLKRYERRKSSKSKRNDFDHTAKRFSVLYKNVEMNRKAVSGLLSLNEDQQIKAEEVVLALDRNPDNVTIKRKVFSGKKNKTTCFEVLFAYNGRLYFKRSSSSMIEVVVIGTKNTQTRDMEYLHSL